MLDTGILGKGAVIVAAGCKTGKACVQLNGSPDSVITFSRMFANYPTSLAMWIKPDKANVVIADTNGRYAIYRLYLNKDAKLVYSHMDNGAGKCLTITSSAPLAIGKWNHLVITVASSEIKMYINGRLDARVATSGNLANDGGTPDFKIGKGVSNQDCFHADRGMPGNYSGFIDDLINVDKILSDQEILAMASADLVVMTAPGSGNTKDVISTIPSNYLYALGAVFGLTVLLALMRGKKPQRRKKRKARR